MDFLLTEHRAGVQSLQQGGRLDVLLHDIEGCCLALALEVIEHAGNARVLEAAEHLGLALEEFEVLPVGQVSKVQLFDDDLSALAQVGAEECARR